MISTWTIKFILFRGQKCISIWGLKSAFGASKSERLCPHLWGSFILMFSLSLSGAGRTPTMHQSDALSHRQGEHCQPSSLQVVPHQEETWSQWQLLQMHKETEMILARNYWWRHGNHIALLFAFSLIHKLLFLADNFTRCNYDDGVSPTTKALNEIIMWAKKLNVTSCYSWSHTAIVMMGWPLQLKHLMR